MADCDVAIIGAGPYGLSTAAHLKAHRVDFRIFGRPMQTWRAHMPKGMRLKSEGFASSLYDPGETFTLEVYCKERKIPYSHVGLPVPLEVFSAYGLEFQKRFVGELDQRQVQSIERTSESFRIRLEDETVLSCRRVVVASGLANYEHIPPSLTGFPEELVTHSSRYHDLEQFRGREITIVGAGSSAVDLAALLHQAGAAVQVLARRSVIRFHDPPDDNKPSLMKRLRNPVTGIGPGWNLYFYANAPLIFRSMPQEFRLRKVRQTLGPAPCWFTKQEVVGKVPFKLGVEIADAQIRNNRVSVRLRGAGGSEETLETEHVIAATGYRADLRKLTFLDQSVKSAIRSAENTPILSSNFESTVPGLYFVGIAAANTFGPLLRFAVGAQFAAPRLSQHLAKTA
ncbi:MAG TPA: NAD(P)/FAD-dependent oxidoreductase [Terracidiphilus sp.]|nr:NAD(P)/FAD-dependent oxidoreductase [Terracidiphilus sp.]